MRRIGIVSVLTLASALLHPGHASEVKTDIPGTGTEKQLIEKPDPVTAGSFDGTWIYVNRDARYAMWIRTRNGKPQIKIQYQSLANPEAFETDWDGKAVYYLAGSPATFDVKLGRADANQIAATWFWDLTLSDSARREKADIVLYRSQFGRNLVMDFQNYERVIVRNGKDSVMKTPVNWTWSKVSRREILWDELPF